MVNFCPECGVKLSSPDVKFCSRCQKQFKNIPDSTSANASAESGLLIFIGLIIIAILYVLPIGHVYNRYYSIAEMNNLCNSALGQVAQLLSQSNECGGINAAFIIGWVMAIIFILFGIVVVLKPEPIKKPEIEEIPPPTKEEVAMNKTEEEKTDFIKEFNETMKNNPEFLSIREYHMNNPRKTFRSVISNLETMGYEIKLNSLQFNLNPALKVTTLDGFINSEKSFNFHFLEQYVKKRTNFIFYFFLGVIFISILGVILGKYFKVPTDFEIFGITFSYLFVFMLMLYVILFLLYVLFFIPSKQTLTRKRYTKAIKSILLLISGEGKPADEGKISDDGSSRSGYDVTIKVIGGIYPLFYKNEDEYDEKILRDDIDNIFQKTDDVVLLSERRAITSPPTTTQSEQISKTQVSKSIPVKPVIRDEEKDKQKMKVVDALNDINEIKTKTPEFYVMKEIKVKNSRKLFRSITNFLDESGYQFVYNFLHHSRDPKLKIITVEGGIEVDKDVSFKRQRTTIKTDWKLLIPHIYRSFLLAYLGAVLAMVVGGTLGFFMSVAYPSGHVRYFPDFPFLNFFQGLWVGLLYYMIYLFIPLFILILILMTKFKFPTRINVIDQIIKGQKYLIILAQGEGYYQDIQQDCDVDSIDVNIDTDMTIKIGGGIYPESIKNIPEFTGKMIKDDIDNVLNKIDEYQKNS